MALEIAGARLLAPSFGSSTPVWATLIGLTLAGLAGGSALGGRWARTLAPTARDGPDDAAAARARVAAAAAAATAGLMTAGAWRLPTALLAAGADAAVALDVGAAAPLLVAAALVVALPTVLLGAVVPLALAGAPLRAAAADGPAAAAMAGAAGRIVALSTLGSLVGTFGAAFGTLPVLGVRRSLAAWGGGLALVAAAALAREPAAHRPRAARAAAAAVVAVAAAFAWAAWRAGGAPPAGHAAAPSGGRLVAWREGREHYIAVVEHGGRRYLRFDEGAAHQSVVDRGAAFTGALWDDLALAPLLAPGAAPPVVRRALVVGLAGGSAARALAAAWPGVAIDGVEIDPDVVAMARAHLWLDAVPGLRVHVADGRAFLHRCPPPGYDLVVLDAYRGPTPPFHLASREAFAAARACLAPGGVVAANVVDPTADGSGHLAGAVAATMATAFGWLGQIAPADAYNALLVGAAAAPADGAVAARAAAWPAGDPAHAAAASLARRWRAASIAADAPVLTDDRAPVERLAAADAWRALRGP